MTSRNGATADPKDLAAEIDAFESSRAELEKHYDGKWVVFHGAKLAGTFDSFDNAASEAVRRFGRGPYLIRQVGAEPPILPASVAYRPVHA